MEEDVNYNKNLLIYDDKDDLDKLRIQDILKKLKASSFKNYLIQRRNELDLITPINCDLEISQGYSNSNAYIDVRFKIKDQNDDIDVIAVQIQGNHFTFAIQRNTDSRKIYIDDFLISTRVICLIAPMISTQIEIYLVIKQL